MLSDQDSEDGGGRPSGVVDARPTVDPQAFDQDPDAREGYRTGAWVPTGVPHPAFRVATSGQPTTLIWDPVPAWRTSSFEAATLAGRSARGAQWLLALGLMAAAVAGATFLYGDSQPQPIIGWPVLAALTAIGLGCASWWVNARSRMWSRCALMASVARTEGRSGQLWVVECRPHARMRSFGAALAVLGATILGAAIDAGNEYDGYASEGRVPDPGFAKAFTLLTLTWLVSLYAVYRLLRRPDHLRLGAPDPCRDSD